MTLFMGLFMWHYTHPSINEEPVKIKQKTRLFAIIVFNFIFEKKYQRSTSLTEISINIV
jgi:hypothetical protein